MTNGWIQRFFSSTRGRIVLLLRRQERTVSDLAEALDLTPNAIRAQLTKLERDELVLPTGKRPAVRKPEIIYGVTEQAETLFPKAYDLLLDQLLQVLAEQDADVEGLLREVGRRVAERYQHRVSADDPVERIEQAGAVLEDMGGLPELESCADEDVVVRGKNCPFGTVAPHHPAVCKMTEALLAHLTGRSVRQACEADGDEATCRFVFDGTEE